MDSGETAAHNIESRQVREGDGDKQGEDEGAEEEDDSRDKINTGGHDCGK